MPKKIYISESMLRPLIMEAVNGKIALNEITSEKAYTDYYSNIPYNQQ